MAIHKVFIPEERFSDCRIIKKAKEWINSELIETDISEDFKGAVFNLNRQDLKLLMEQGINVTIDDKKIYCYRDINLMETVEFKGKQYSVVSGKEYMIHDELRIYYIQRIKDE